MITVYFHFAALGIKANLWLEVLWWLVRHIRLSNNFNAWRGWQARKSQTKIFE